MHNKAVTSEKDINHIIINSLLDIKGQLLQKDWGNVTHTVPYQSFLLPRTARELVHLIDETVKMSPVPSESALIHTLKRITAIPDNREEYQDIKTMTNALISVVLLMTEEMIGHEIDQYKKPESKIEKAWLNNLIVQLKLMQSQKAQAVPEVEILVNARENLSALKESYIQELSKPDTQLEAQKEAKFFRNKIEPFYDNLKAGETGAAAVNNDLQACVSAMILQTMHPEQEIVSIRRNGLDELEVTTENGTYNLTQILKHDPNFSELMLDSAQLDAYAAYLSNSPELYIENFPVDTHEKDTPYAPGHAKTPEQMKSELNTIIRKNGKDNVFENCHIANCMAINLYTGDAYVVLNAFLRQKTMPKDLFVPKKDQDRLVFNALQVLERKLRGSNTGKPLTDQEANLLTQQATMAIVIASKGLAQAKPVVFDPAKDVKIQEGELETTQGRTVRGAAGDWVADTKEQYAFANEAGMPIYYDGFMSSSFSTDIANQFMLDKSKTMVSKVNTYNVDLQSGSGVIVSDISRFRKENEYLFPPGSIILPDKETRIKRREHYGDIGKEQQITTKVSQVVTTGNSPKAQYYSPLTQQKRMALIQEYENITVDSSLTPVEKEEKRVALRGVIDQLASQLKQVDIVLMKTLPATPDIRARCGKADAVFLMAENGETVFLDKHANTATPLSLDASQKAALITSLKIPEHAAKLQNNDDNIPIFNNLDLVKIAWLEKNTGFVFPHGFSEETSLMMQEKTLQSLPEYISSKPVKMPQHLGAPIETASERTDSRVTFETAQSGKNITNPVSEKPAPPPIPDASVTQEYKEKLESMQKDDATGIQDNRWIKLN